MIEETRKRLAGLRIREARRAAGLSQVDLAKRLSLPQSVISDWERGELQSWRDYIPALSQHLDRPASYFAADGETTSSVNTSSVREIPVVGEVQGGAFRMAYEFPADEREFVPLAAAAYPAYAGVQLRALRVVGPSVNELYPDGTYVIVVSSADTDVRHGDRVVVFSRQGALCESTIKEVRVEGSRVVLHPRSSHPDHQSPIYLDPADQDGPEIAYVVIGSYRPEERPPPPIRIPPRR
jgi:transcriptional regulator with XRE-family HTH domain